MERMTPWMRPNGMLGQGQVRGLVVAGVLCAALAGCGSVVASNQPGGLATGAPAATSQVGCASVNQATMATIHRTMRLVQPVAGGTFAVTQRKASLVRALFGDLCNAVTHPYTSKQVIRCPGDFGTSYLGTFYDGTRVLATFTYAASGCQRVTVTAAGKTQGTMVYGRAAAAAPHLVSDLNAAVGLPRIAVLQPAGSVNPGGPNKPA
jgi:hypothetical protein